MAFDSSAPRRGRRRAARTRTITLLVASAIAWPCLASSNGGVLPGFAPSTPSSDVPSHLTQRLRMIFPANPPPLGAWIPRTEKLLPPVTDPARPLCGDMLEPYFAPLSTYLIDLRLSQEPKLSDMIEEYRARRGELVVELHRTINSARPLPAAERLAIFSALATEQEARLVALEQAAETIRSGVARDVGWNRWRRWRLGEGELTGPRENHGMFEYQVIRAAAFYQEGLTPAQRRLLRETASRMEAGIFGQPDSASALFEFFSPDLMLVRFPANLPQSIADDIALHAQRKEALRTELRDALYAADHLRSERRQRLLKELAVRQHPGLDALEQLAEQIRRDLAGWTTSWRRTAPPPLPAAIQSQLDAYLALQRQHQIDYEHALAPVRLAWPPMNALGNPEALKEWREEKQQRIEEATQAFLREQAATVADLLQRLRQLDEALLPYYDSSDLGTEKESLLNFLHRRRQETSYFEYEIAAFEPGLSPRQRTLLFAAAVARLELPLPAPERQPVKAPATIIK